MKRLALILAVAFSVNVARAALDAGLCNASVLLTPQVVATAATGTVDTLAYTGMATIDILCGAPSSTLTNFVGVYTIANGTGTTSAVWNNVVVYTNELTTATTFRIPYQVGKGSRYVRLIATSADGTNCVGALFTAFPQK